MTNYMIVPQQIFDKYPEILISKRSKDLTNKKFGSLTALYPTKSQQTYYSCPSWVCLCDCGNYAAVPSYCLTSGNTKSCGDKVHQSNKPKTIKNRNKIVGQVVNGVKIDSYNHEETLKRLASTHQIYYNCVCELCGNKFLSSKGQILSKRRSKGCGVCGELQSQTKIRQKNFSLIEGKTFNYLTPFAINEDKTNTNDHGDIIVDCLCKCGNITSVSIYELTHNKIKSCGCLTKEKASVIGYQNLQKSKLGATSKFEQLMCRIIIDKYQSFIENYCDITNSQLCLNLNNKRYYYDLAITLKNGLKLIVECQGLAYHVRSPQETFKRGKRKGEPWMHPKQHISAKEQFEKDEQKRIVAEQNGYKVLYVWDDVSIEENTRLVCEEINQLLVSHY